MVNQSNKIVAILGPTAVGKTNISITVARKFNGEVVSCDSVQIYKFLNIGSAKPTSAEQSLAFHHLIDVFSPKHRVNVGEYKRLAEKAIQSILANNRLPIVAGGTGMYFNSLYYGLFEGETRNDDFRAELEAQVDAEGLAFLYSRLNSQDPAASEKIYPNDKYRIIRALEVLHTTGKSITELQKENLKLDLKWHIILLNIDRAILYERINARVDKMIDAGLIEETQALVDEHGANAYALGSIGYKHCLRYLSGEWNKDELIYQLKRDTRRYAKRQLTWFRRLQSAMPSATWYAPSDEERILNDIERFLET